MSGPLVKPALRRFALVDRPLEIAITVSAEEIRVAEEERRRPLVDEILRKLEDALAAGSPPSEPLDRFYRAWTPRRR